MQNFICDCGQQIYFENTHCVNCQRLLGFHFANLTLLSLTPSDNGTMVSFTGAEFKSCRNQIEFGICNWIIPAESPNDYCPACALNEMVPAITAQDKRLWWGNMEQAKRRLLFTLARLGLPVGNRHESSHGLGLAFAFLEDQRINPAVAEAFVNTGHSDGLITVYLAEADEARRESARVAMGEPYRTLLGHFRHESGHYYFDVLLRNSALLPEFRALFGDESGDYETALANYYRQPPAADGGDFISSYASAHPLEDWAECWAHYLHMVDTLETAAAFGLVKSEPFINPIEAWLKDWQTVTIMLNALNRSMGLRDAYPFVLSETSLKKLHFVHRVIYPR